MSICTIKQGIPNPQSSPSGVKMLGVTPPISTDPPKPEDIKASEGELPPLLGLLSDVEPVLKEYSFDGGFGCHEPI